MKALRAIDGLSLQNPIELEPGKIIEYDITKDELNTISSYNLEPYFSKNSENILKLGEELHKVLR